MREAGEATKAIQVRIEGRVQGVFYRGWAVQQATARGLRGWVRNRSDGSVEALFAGSVGAVDGMLEACWQGPPAAHVRRITASDATYPERIGFYATATV